MKASYRLFNLLTDEEDFIAHPYLDAVKIWTIGWGHVILQNENFTTITKEQGQELLKRDVSFAEDCINEYVTAPLTQNQFDALVSFIFNIGCTAFKDSTLLKLLNDNDYDGASKQFLRWNKARGNIITGLTNRRKREMELFTEE